MRRSSVEVAGRSYLRAGLFGGPDFPNFSVIDVCVRVCSYLKNCQQRRVEERFSGTAGESTAKTIEPWKKKMGLNQSSHTAFQRMLTVILEAEPIGSLDGMVGSSRSMHCRIETGFLKNIFFLNSCF